NNINTNDIMKIQEIYEQCQISKQIRSYLVNENKIQNPKEYISPLPHISFVESEDNVDFLKRRFKALSNLPMFAEMAYSENPITLNEWIPLMMKSRHLNEKIAATHVASGTDVNFGALTRKLIHHIEMTDKV